MKYPKDKIKAVMAAIYSVQDIMYALFGDDRKSGEIKEDEIKAIFFHLNTDWLKLNDMLKEEDRPSV